MELTELEMQQRELRLRRTYECFQYINRGKLWYDNLSESKLNELRDWYQKWLDVTITLQPPERLKWL